MNLPWGEILFSGACCLVVFAAALLGALLAGPPAGRRCADGKAHEFGQWECDGPGLRQRRRCGKCGWTEWAH